MGPFPERFLLQTKATERGKSTEKRQTPTIKNVSSLLPRKVPFLY
jgi:hypothetical protein